MGIAGGQVGKKSVSCGLEGGVKGGNGGDEGREYNKGGEEGGLIDKPREGAS